MRRIRFRFAAIAAAAVATAPLLVLGPASPAQADPIPPTNYSPISIADTATPGSAYLGTHIDGSVTAVRPCGGDSAYTFKTFASNGAVTQSRPYYPYGNPNYYPAYCGIGWAIAADGTTYFSAMVEENQPGVLAFKNNQLVWTYRFNCGRYVSVNSMTVGADGNVYLAFYQGNSDPACAYSMLVGLSPGVQPGTSSPQVVLKKAIDGDINGDGLAAYSDGLVLRQQNAVRYVTYSGAVGVPMGFTPALASAGYGEQFSATLGGRVFIAHRASPDATTGCPSPDTITGRISALEPTGEKWSANLQGCHYVYDLRPLPSGGVVVYAQQYIINQPREDKLIGFDQNGNQTWTKTLDNTGLDTYGGTSLSVDLNGNVAVRRNVTVGKTINGSYWRFPEIRFELRSGSTGDRIPGATIALRGDTTTTSGPAYGWVDWYAKTGKNTAYVAASTCSAYSCDNSTAKLYAFKVPGAELDYPSAAVLMHNLPRENLAVLGDSYSSGQGVRPYDSGTEASGPPGNDCRQSAGAYGRLMGTNPSSQFNLTAFKACGGATTRDVVNGRVVNGWVQKPEQLSAVTKNTNIVMLTIGGNDADFEGFAFDCFDLTPGAHCDGNSEQEAINKIENELPGNLSYMLGEIGGRLDTGARVLVVGYPRMIESADFTLPYCAYLSSEEKLAIQHVINRLNSQLIQGVDRARAVFESKGIRLDYVDVNGPGSQFAGRGLCQQTSYFNGAVPNDISASFHPNAGGHLAYRQEIEAWLVRNP